MSHVAKIKQFYPVMKNMTMSICNYMYYYLYSSIASNVAIKPIETDSCHSKIHYIVSNTRLEKTKTWKKYHSTSSIRKPKQTKQQTKENSILIQIQVLRSDFQKSYTKKANPFLLGSCMDQGYCFWKNTLFSLSVVLDLHFLLSA